MPATPRPGTRPDRAFAPARDSTRHYRLRGTKSLMPIAALGFVSELDRAVDAALADRPGVGVMQG
jgi:hypothetical protein